MILKASELTIFQIGLQDAALLTPQRRVQALRSLTQALTLPKVFN